MSQREPKPVHPHSPVRVGRFEWERLMLSSDLPRPTKNMLLILAIYMSENGSNARPGLENLMTASGKGRTVCIDHLKVAVDSGYLVAVERGGFRQGNARASEYAASVPEHVHCRKAEILASPPWRRPADEGPTSGKPYVQPGGEGPENRTFSKHEGPVFGDEGPVSRGRRSENPDPTTQLHHVPTPPTYLRPEQANGNSAKTGGKGRLPALHAQALAVIAESLAVTDPDADPDDEDLHATYTEVVRSAPSPPKSVKYFQTVAGNSGFSGYYAAARKRRNERDKQRRTEWRAVVDACPDRCGHGERGGHLVSPITGEAMCPKCRRGLPADSGHGLPPDVAAAVSAFGQGWTAGNHGPPNHVITGRVLNQITRYLEVGLSPADVALLAELAGKAGTDLDALNGQEAA